MVLSGKYGTIIIPLISTYNGLTQYHYLGESIVPYFPSNHAIFVYYNIINMYTVANFMNYGVFESKNSYPFQDLHQSLI